MVTISIPIYNAENYLRDTIQSVINQTYKDWILYLMNDGSTDGSLFIMEEFALKDSRIRIIDDGKNMGLIARLNQSIQMTDTKYYARMDADDIMYITRIEEQVKYLESHPDIDVLGSSIMTIDKDNNIVGSGMSTGKVNGFVHPTVMGKTSWFKANPYCDWAVRAEDFELWSRTFTMSNFWALDKPLLFYREFGVPTTKKYIQSQTTLLKIYSHYNSYNKPFCWFMKNSLITILKIIAYQLFDLFGRTDILVQKRNRRPLPYDKCLLKDDLMKSIKRSI